MRLPFALLIEHEHEHEHDSSERMDGQRLNAVMSNSFGFGGTNASLVFERFADE